MSLVKAGAGGQSVASDVGGVRAVIEHEVTRLLVRPAVWGGLQRAAERSFPALSSGWYRNAARIRSQQFALSRLVSDIRSLYDELVRRRRNLRRLHAVHEQLLRA